jgi:hypothetical protein
MIPSTRARLVKEFLSAIGYDPATAPTGVVDRAGAFVDALEAAMGDGREPPVNPEPAVPPVASPAAGTEPDELTCKHCGLCTVPTGVEDEECTCCLGCIGLLSERESANREVEKLRAEVDWCNHRVKVAERVRDNFRRMWPDAERDRDAALARATRAEAEREEMRERLARAIAILDAFHDGPDDHNTRGKTIDDLSDALYPDAKPSPSPSEEKPLTVDDLAAKGFEPHGRDPLTGGVARMADGTPMVKPGEEAKCCAECALHGHVTWCNACASKLAVSAPEKEEAKWGVWCTIGYIHYGHVETTEQWLALANGEPWWASKEAALDQAKERNLAFGRLGNRYEARPLSPAAPQKEDDHG